MGDFVLFGCWNRGNAKDNDFSKVIKLINDKGHSKPSKVYVTGDNYYPIKREINPDQDEEYPEGKKVEKKQEGKEVQVETRKYYNSDDMASGFEKLNELTPRLGPIEILFGNHDLEEIKKDIYDSETNQVMGEGTECTITEQQNTIIAQNEKFSWAQPVSKFGKHTLVICITSVFFTPDAANMTTCFEKIGKSFEGEMKEINRNLTNCCCNRP